MNLRDAKRYVYRCLEQALVSDLSNGSLWLEQDPKTCEEMSAADQQRVLRAVDHVRVELTRKAGNKP